MPYMVMEHAIDPKKKLTEEIGDLKNVEIFNNQVLLAVYMRPEKTKSGLFMPDSHRDEDRHQSKVGLVLKMGPNAFIDDTNTWFKDVNVEGGDWLVFRPSDGWPITVNGVLCRMLDDTNIRGRVQHPDEVW